MNIDIVICACFSGCWLTGIRASFC